VTVPHSVKIAVLVLVTTAFYGYVGQLVPQREVQPPEETILRADMTTADMVQVGGELMVGKGLCLTCHTIGRSGALRFPDLEGVAVRAATRIEGLSDIEYLAQSLYEPDRFIVEGFNPGMPVINKPPIGLTDPEILCVIAYLQTLGGTATVTLQSSHNYYGGAPAPGGTPAAGGAAAPGGAVEPVPPPASAAPGGEKPPAPPVKKGADLTPVVPPPSMVTR
jgi:hypothetical protein